MTWTIRVPNWREFQNYAERRPPWIKLHRMLLEKPAWRRLPGSAAKLLVDVWMLAAGSKDGEITMTLTDLAYSVRLPEADVRADLLHLQVQQFLEVGPDLQAPASAGVQEGTKRVPEQRRAETETEQRQSSRAARGRRETWLTPFGAAWEAAYGGQPKYGKLASHLKPLVDAHGPEQVLAHWGEFLRATEAKYASASRFAETFGTWGRTKPRGAQYQSVDDADRKAGILP